MSRMVQCVVLGTQAEGLEEPPHPGALGQRIFEEVSAEGWRQWLDHLTMVINENGLNTADPRSIAFIEEYMLGFIFKEGQYSDTQMQAAPRKK